MYTPVWFLACALDYVQLTAAVIGAGNFFVGTPAIAEQSVLDKHVLTDAAVTVTLFFVPVGHKLVIHATLFGCAALAA
jgi:hypothetical protein